MTAARMRLVLVGVAVVGVAGMIITSIADSPDGALVFGMLTAAAALAMVSTTAVTNGGSAIGPDELAGEVEATIDDLVAAGVDEGLLRHLVRASVRLGRSTSTD